MTTHPPPTLTDDQIQAARPRTRAECPARDEAGRRVCAWLGCRHHLGLDIHRRPRARRAHVIPHPALGPDGDDVEALTDALAGSCCALDHADDGPRLLEEVGALMTSRSSRRGASGRPLSRQSVQQIEVIAFERIRRVWPEGAEWLAALAPDPQRPRLSRLRIARSPHDDAPTAARHEPAPRPPAIEALPAHTRAVMRRAWDRATAAPEHLRHEGWRLRVARLCAGLTIDDLRAHTGAGGTTASKAERHGADRWTDAERDHAERAMAWLGG